MEEHHQVPIIAATLNHEDKISTVIVDKILTLIWTLDISLLSVWKQDHQCIVEFVC